MVVDGDEVIVEGVMELGDDWVVVDEDEVTVEGSRTMGG